VNLKVLKVREYTYPTYVGGIEVCLKELCPALAQMGAEVFLVTCGERGLPGHSVEKNVHTFRVNFMFIGALTPHLKQRGMIYRMLPRALFLLVLPLYLVRYIRELQIDVLHVHCLSLLSAVPTSLTGWLLKKPVLISQHGTFYEVYRDIMPFPFNWLLPFLEEKFLNHGFYSKVLVEDNYTKKILLKLDVPEEKIVWLPYPGVDVAKFASAEKNPSEKVIVLHHGRLVKKRGVKHLVRAFRAVSERFPEAELVIAGEGPERKRLVKLAHDLGVSNRVRFIGQVPHEKVPNLVRNSDVFVIPSIIEGHSTSMLEAMAAGKPVVATRVGGLTEVIVDGENGVLVDPANPEQIAKAVIKLLGDRSLAARLGRSGAEKAQQFDVKQLARQEFDVYKTVV
jgi:glycosyltransferase involved in cell wall biosynthesis